MRHVLAIATLAAAALIAGCTNDVGVTCPPGQTLCGETCVYTSSDPNNCGSCGNACGDLVCIAGVCGCPKGQTACNGKCVDTTSDVNDCGACGTACPTAQVCSMSACSGSCATGLTNCSRDCVNLNSDDSNCGACGAACASGTHCQGGTCTQECPTGQVLCGGRCVSLVSDGANCGACGNVCPNDYFCIFGSCILGCPKPLTRCIPDGGQSDGGSQCIETRFDPNNCGGCGGADVTPPPFPSTPPITPHICKATPGFNDDAVCDNGRCAWVCSAGMLDCTLIDEEQGDDARTRSSISTPRGDQPPPNTGATEVQCSNPTNDNCNCGGCGVTCGNYENEGPNDCFNFSSDEGQTFPSPDDSQCCNSSCMEVGDVEACGNCAGVTNCFDAVPAPSNPACCPVDRAHPDTGNNTCRDLANDVHSCGACNRDCNGPFVSAPPGVTFNACCDESCVDLTQLSTCGSSCTNIQNCLDDDLRAPGCCPPGPSNNPCVDFANDVNNCNTCGNACTGTTPSCCPVPSPSVGAAVGTCADTDSDDHNCGSCGEDCTTDCGNTSHCVGGECTNCER